jgi:Neuraminidase (sialidase)
VTDTTIAVNPNNPQDLLAGATDLNCSNQTGFYSSSDGGKNWSTYCIQNLPGEVGDGSPGVGYDLHGNSYITGFELNSPAENTEQTIFQKSSDNGKHWSAPAIAVNPLFPGGYATVEHLQIDDTPSSPHANALYISNTQINASFTQSLITVTHSYNGGKTWKTVTVDTVHVVPVIDKYSDLAIGKDGTIYVSWMHCLTSGPAGDCGGTKVEELISKSTDGGNTWSSPVIIAQVQLVPDTCGCGDYYGNIPNTKDGADNFPVIDIDNSRGPYRGNLYAAFYNWTGSQMQVEVATSTDGGSSWRAPVRVTTASNDEFFPWLSVSPTGIVGVTWMDRRNDPQNLSYEEFGALSWDGGASFGTNYQLASQPSNPNNDGFGGTYIGYFTGNCWAGKKLYAVWTDTRGGNDQEFIGGIETNT